MRRWSSSAIVAGLGISGLAIGLAAQPIIADALAAIIIVIERQFKIGDVIRLGATDPAQVIGLSLRSTKLRTTDGLLMTIPNRRIVEARTENLARGSSTYDSLMVTVTTDKDPAQVVAAIESALAACAQITCQMVATAMGVPTKRIEVTVEGDLDLRGTLGIAKDAPVGFEQIRMRFAIDAPDATGQQLSALREKTEQYCVVMQTLTRPPSIGTEWSYTE